MSEKPQMDLYTDPRGRTLLKIHDMTTEMTDRLSFTDASYVPVYEGFTAYETVHNSIRVYLVIAKGCRVLLYGVEVPSVPKGFIFSRAESKVYRKDVNAFTCMRIVMDHPDDVSYLLAQETDDEILGYKTIVPDKNETGEEFIQRNAVWLSDPIIN